MWGLEAFRMGVENPSAPQGLPAMQQQFVPPPKMEATCASAGEGAEDQSFPKFITVWVYKIYEVCQDT